MGSSLADADADVKRVGQQMAEFVNEDNICIHIYIHTHSSPHEHRHQLMTIVSKCKKILSINVPTSPLDNMSRTSNN